MDTDTVSVDSSPPTIAIDGVIEDTERWFVRQGLPHFIADYTAAEKVLPRTVPVLTLSFLVSVTTTINREWPLWRNLAAVFVGFLALVGIWAAVNRVQGLPALRRPERTGAVEVLVFIFGPAALDFLTRSPEAVLSTVLINVVQLVVIYISTSYGLVPLTYWSIRRVLGRLDLAFRLAGRTLPLLLLGVTFLLFNGALWQSVVLTPLPRYLLLLSLFVGMSLLFLYQLVIDQFDTAVTFDSSDEIRRYCMNSPVSQALRSVPAEIPTPPKLTRRERTNLILLALVSAWEYVFVVCLMVLVFFVLFGLLAIPPVTVVSLVGQSTREIFTIVFFTSPISLTTALLRISGFIAVFSGFYLAIHMSIDETFRSQLDGSVREQVRTALAVRAVYLTLLDRE